MTEWQVTPWQVMLGGFLIGAPSWILPAVLMAAVILLFAALGYRRTMASLATKSLGLLLKVVGVLLLAICLVEPLFSGVRPRPGANLFVVLTDNSRSMTTQSGSDVRGDTMKKLLDQNQDWRKRLEQDFDVRDYMFDAQVKHAASPEDITLDGSGSALHTALDTIATRFQDRPIAGVLLLSDGNATDATVRNKFDFPIYPLIDDDLQTIRDVSIRQMAVTQTNFEASPITVTATMANAGFEGASLTARIVNAKGETIQEIERTPDKQTDLEFRFRFRPDEPGLSFQRLEVFPTAAQKKFERADVGQELTLANNSRWITVDRGGGPYRVLYVSGRPNYEFKFLRRALEEDDEIQLTGLQRIAKKQPKFAFRDRSGVSDRNQLFEGFDGKDDEDAETYDQPVLIRLGVKDESELRDGFPKDAEELFPYHAVILDDIEAKFFTADQMLLLRRFVSQRGGGFMMLGGQESFVNGDYNKTPIGELLPVYVNRAGEHHQEPQRYRWTLSREGWLQDWTRLRATEAAERKQLAELPGFQVVNLVDGLKPGASLLAAVAASDGKPVPALATQRFGKGRTSALLVGDLWMWQMHQQDPKQRDLQQLWRQMIRWLVADVPNRVEVRSYQRRGAAGPRTIEVSVNDHEYKAHDNAEVQVVVTTPNNETIELTAEASSREAGHYEVDYWPREDGPYRARADVTSADGEKLEPKETGWTTEPAADEFRRLNTDRALLAQLAEQSGGELIESSSLDEFVSGLPNRKIPITETWVYPIWHQPWVLGLAIFCLCGEWGLRRWRGLP